MDNFSNICNLESPRGQIFAIWSHREDKRLCFAILRHQPGLKLSHGDNFCADGELLKEAFHLRKNHLRAMILGHVGDINYKAQFPQKNKNLINLVGCT